MSWYPAAVRHPGPASKVWPEPNQHVGVICHSVEGYIAAALNELDDGNQPLSWHFTIDKQGTVYQHYDLSASCWHAGSHAQNNLLIGIEHEGVKGEPLTEMQAAASVALVRWIASECGWAMSRAPASRTLWEHREVPASNTTCPNDRIPWSRYMPTNDPNHEDNYDTGLTRINAEAAVESIAKIHKQAEGDAFYLIQVINRTFGVNYHL